MIRLVTILILSSVLLLHSCGPTIEGNGNVITETRSVEEFSSVNIGGAFEVVLREGDVPEVSIEADDNLLEIIETEVSGKTLRIGTRQWISKAEKLAIYITYTSLESIDISGAATLTTKSPLEGNDFAVSVSGATSMDLDVDLNSLVIDVTGGGEAKLKGNARNLELNVSGAGKLMAYELATEKASVHISGAGEAELDVKQTLDVSISGAGRITYKGDPTVNQSVSGAGDIRKAE